MVFPLWDLVKQEYLGSQGITKFTRSKFYALPSNYPKDRVYISLQNFKLSSNLKCK